MKKRWINLVGIFLILAGFLFLVNSFSITGFVVFDNVAKEFGSRAGVILISLGVLVFSLGREFYHHKSKSQHGLREHNNEARRAVREKYKETFGIYPNNHQLRVYERRLHERDEIPDIVEEQHEKIRHRRKAG